jgi:hypothetical protein
MDIPVEVAQNDAFVEFRPCHFDGADVMGPFKFLCSLKAFQGLGILMLFLPKICLSVERHSPYDIFLSIGV